MRDDIDNIGSAGAAVGVLLAALVPSAFHVATCVLLVMWKGWLFGVGGFFLPVVAEVYLLAVRWMEVGVLNGYTYACAAVAVAYVAGFLLYAGRRDG